MKGYERDLVKYDQPGTDFTYDPNTQTVVRLEKTLNGAAYRSWLDAVGTAIAVQQKLMRYSDIRTTLNVYGDVVTDEMAQAFEGRALGHSEAVLIRSDLV